MEVCVLILSLKNLIKTVNQIEIIECTHILNFVSIGLFCFFKMPAHKMRTAVSVTLLVSLTVPAAAAAVRLLIAPQTS